MSLGFSVGDFITVLQLANNIRKQFVDAPSQFKQISEGVKSLSNILRDIDDVLSEPELTSQQKTELNDAAEGFHNNDVLPAWELTSQQKAELHDIAKGCLNVLNELKETLKKYQELDSNSNCKTFVRKARRVWKRLEWEPDDIRDLRSRVTSNISLFNAFNGRLISQVSLETKHSVDQLYRRQNLLFQQSLATKDSVDWLHEHQDNRERREEHQVILDWLTPIDYASQQSDFIARRQEGTGLWLLHSNEFQGWLNQSAQTLFCPGIPGAGKTMITSIIVKHLQTKFQTDPNIAIAYLYCNFRRQQEQKPVDLLASLLKQLIQQRLSVPENVTSLYKHHYNERTRPSFDEISKVLRSTVTNYYRAFIIIDALDECHISDGGRRILLSDVFNLQVKTGVNLFATSRFIPEIMKEFEQSTSLEIRASDEDVQRYLDGHMSQLPSFVLRSPDLQEGIKTEIVKAVDGMFLLAQLHLGSLIGKRSPKAIRIALERLPKVERTLNVKTNGVSQVSESEAYDYAYKEAMERIECQIADSQELAKQVLSWIICAKRPLTTLELRYALAVEIGESELDEENLPEIEDMVSMCAGLVTVDEESDIIRLVHYTTQEYFERTQMSWFPNAQTDITKTCVTYLSFNAFETGICPTYKEFEARLRSNVLYDYAARNWGHHARAATAEMEKLILDLLESEAKVSGSSQAMMASGRYSDYNQTVPRQMTGVHLAAYFGLVEATTALLKNGHNSDSKDSNGRTPLSWAARSGHDAVVKLLLEKGAELESKDTNGQTPLSWAAENGHDAVVKLLLEKGAELVSKDTNGRTPLSWAAGNGCNAMVKLLLEKGAELVSKDKYGLTPLSLAAGYGHDAIVEQMLEKGAELESKDTNGQTPLSWAARSGHDAVVKLLLEKGAELESKDTNGLTPLLWALRYRHDAMVKLLLEKGAEKPQYFDLAIMPWQVVPDTSAWNIQ